MLSADVPHLEKEGAPLFLVFEALPMACVRKGLTRKTGKTDVERRDAFFHFFRTNVKAPIAWFCSEVLGIGVSGVAVFFAHKGRTHLYAAFLAVVERILKAEPNSADSSKKIYGR